MQRITNVKGSQVTENLFKVLSNLAFKKAIKRNLKDHTCKVNLTTMTNNKLRSDYEHTLSFMKDECKLVHHTDAESQRHPVILMKY